MTKIQGWINYEITDFQSKLFNHFQNLGAKEFGTYINFRNNYKPSADLARIWVKKVI